MTRFADMTPNARRMRAALKREARQLSDDGLRAQAETVAKLARDADDDTLANLYQIIRAL